MSALESLIATGGEAPLLDSLSFDLPPASTAVVDRKQNLRAYPSSASTLTPSGTKTCRIRLGGNDFCNVDTVRLQFNITNTDGTNSLYPVTGPWGVWSQVRLLSGGVELDNVPYYGRHHEMHGWRLTTSEQQYNEAIYGLHGGVNQYYGVPLMGNIAPNGSAAVSHKLLLSAFMSGKMWPLRYAPLELEVTLGPNTDWLIAGTGKSTGYSVSNLQIYYDGSVLDEAVQESFYKALLSNRVLNVPVMQCFQVSQPIPTGQSSFSFSAVRAFSRLAMVWITFRGTGQRTQEFLFPTALAAGEAEGNIPVFVADQAPSIRLSVGPKYWPDPAPIATVEEHFSMLQKALPGPVFIDRNSFCTSTFASVFDLRRTVGDPTSALSTRSGDLLRVGMKNLTGTATECYMTIWAFGVVAIRESGVTLLD